MHAGQQITYALTILLGGLLPITQIMDAADLTTSTGTS
jgi:hypothetical protein